VRATAPLAHWAVRLEDVHPLGNVSLITGGIQNGAHRDGRHIPAFLRPHEYYTLDFDLHFTTWKFSPGHRIRIAVSNGLFRMIWPLPHPMISYLKIGDSFIEIPVVSDEGIDVVEPEFTNIRFTEYIEPPDAFHYAAGAYPRYYKIRRNEMDESTSVTWVSDYYSNIKGTFIGAMLAQRFWTNDNNPAYSLWNARASQLYVYDFPKICPDELLQHPKDLLIGPYPKMKFSKRKEDGVEPKFLKEYIQEFQDFYEALDSPIPGDKHQQLDLLHQNIGFNHLKNETQYQMYHPQYQNNTLGFKKLFYSIPNVDLNLFHWIELRTELELTSDESKFYCKLTRNIYENDTLIFTKEFQEEFPRQFQ